MRKGKQSTKDRLSRRSLSRMISSSVDSATLSPTVVGVAKSRRSHSIVLGSGTHLYEVVEGWGELPNGMKYGYTHGLAIDSENQIYIHNQSKDAVIVFDEKGKFIKSWGQEFEKGAHGMHINKEDKEEFLYLADNIRHLVVKTRLNGDVVWTITYPKESNLYQSEEQFKPTNVAVAPDGHFYVADGYGLSFIHQYNSRAEYIRSWGGKGTEPGKMNCPHGIWVDTRGAKPIIIVADRANVRLQNFTLDGKFLGMVTEELRYPCHFDQFEKDLYIPDLHGRLTIFDQNNKLIVHLGDSPGIEKVLGYPNLPHDQRILGKFISPHSAKVDRKGNIYVVEWINDGRVTKLRRINSHC